MNSRFLRVAGMLLVGAVLMGAFEAWMWSRVAPSVRYQVFGNQSWAPLPTETQHIFVAFAIFALIGLLTGVSAAVIGWSFRSVRGAEMLVTVGLAAFVCTAIAGWLGSMWVSGTDPATVASIQGVQTIVSAPPEMRGLAGYLAAPVAAVVTYLVLVAWNGLPDLGRTPSPGVPGLDPFADRESEELDREEAQRVPGWPAAASADPGFGPVARPDP